MTDTYKVIQADIDTFKAIFDMEEAFMDIEGDDAETLQILAKHREDTEALIVGWLRGKAGIWHGLHPHTANCIASMIERGDHHTNNTPGD